MREFLPETTLTAFLTYDTTALHTLDEVLLQQDVDQYDGDQHQHDAGIQIEILDGLVVDLELVGDVGDQRGHSQADGLVLRDQEQFGKEGIVVLKFWLHIDKDEQLKRFNERMNTPEKRWKITDEDWRNREKWDLYEEAIDEIQETENIRNEKEFFDLYRIKIMKLDQ